jgi:hypothetical protein
MTDIVRKVSTACAFGTPNALVTVEIVEEVRALLQERDELKASVDGVKEHLTKLAMARSDGPNMDARKMLSVLADLVDGICEAVNYE